MPPLESGGGPDCRIGHDKDPWFNVTVDCQKESRTSTVQYSTIRYMFVHTPYVGDSTSED